MMAERLRDERVRRWRELGAEGRLRLGSSLIDLGRKLGEAREAERREAE